jgi:hypothetical protein
MPPSEVCGARNPSYAPLALVNMLELAYSASLCSATNSELTGTPRTTFT